LKIWKGFGTDNDAQNQCHRYPSEATFDMALTDPSDLTKLVQAGSTSPLAQS